MSWQYGVIVSYWPIRIPRILRRCGWIVWMDYAMIRSGNRIGLYILPVLVGMVCFLIANATNPYLENMIIYGHLLASSIDKSMASNSSSEKS